MSVALRGQRSCSAILPRCEPVLLVTTSPCPRVTSTSPANIMENSRAVVPSLARAVPAGSSTASKLRRTSAAFVGSRSRSCTADRPSLSEPRNLLHDTFRRSVGTTVLLRTSRGATDPKARRSMSRACHGALFPPRNSEMNFQGCVCLRAVRPETQSDRSVLDARPIHGCHPHDLACALSGAVVLHVSDDGLPTLSVPSVHMTAVRSGPVAVPNLSDLCRTCLERGEATLHETRLAFHEPTLRPRSNQSCRAAPY